MSKRGGAEQFVRFGYVIEGGDAVVCVEEGTWDAVEGFDCCVEFCRFGDGVFLRVGTLEDLGGGLAEVVDYTDFLGAFFLVGDGVEVHGALVGHPVEDVGGFDGSFAALFVAEDEVDPVMQVLAHVWALECFTLFCDEDGWVALRPWR